MFGIGWTEAVLIAIIMLLFVGPKHLPGMLRKAGKVVGDLKNASRELQNQLELETREIRASGGVVGELRREALDLVQSPYEEARRMDEELERDVREAARLDTPAEPDDEGRGPGDGSGGEPGKGSGP